MKERELLISSFLDGGFKIGEDRLDKFHIYLRELTKWNEKVNLTGIGEGKELIIKLFVDSAYPSRFIHKGSEVLDIGSGAGFPGLVLAILFPDTSFTLAEARGKKASFLKRIAMLTGLKNVSVWEERLDSRKSWDGGLFDLVISKAAGQPGAMALLGSSYVKAGGKLLLMTGAALELECSGLVTGGVTTYKLPGGFGERTLMVFKRL